MSNFAEYFSATNEDFNPSDLVEKIYANEFANHKIDLDRSTMLSWVDFELVPDNNEFCNMIVEFKRDKSQYIYYDVDLARVLSFLSLIQLNNSQVVNEYSAGKFFIEHFKNQNFNYTKLPMVE
tara:strand:+ start:1577 stop:1945 length:369 start_codon:yes stop_codon:yes gene_type:complete